MPLDLSWRTVGGLIAAAIVSRASHHGKIPSTKPLAVTPPAPPLLLRTAGLRSVHVCRRGRRRHPSPHFQVRGFTSPLLCRRRPGAHTCVVLPVCCSAVVGFGLKQSTALSQATIAASGLGSCFYTLSTNHPHDDTRPLADLRRALVLTPALLLGVSVGKQGCRGALRYPARVGGRQSTLHDAFCFPPRLGVQACCSTRWPPTSWSRLC
jgi:hypothetical protein